MAEVRNRFKVLLAQKELRDGRTYSYEDISKETGLSPTTLTSYARGRVSRFDSSTLIALCDWLDCDLSDLIEYPPEASRQGAAVLATAT
jgi:putative transcriptional regulator